MEGERRPGGTQERTGRPHDRDLRGVQARVDLIAGTHHIAPIQESISGKETDVPGELITELDTELGNDCEPAMHEATTVAWQGQHAA